MGMNANEYYAKWLVLTDETELRQSFMAAMAEESAALVAGFLEIVKELSDVPARLSAPEERGALALSLLYLNLSKAEGYHQDFLKIILAPEFATDNPMDWLRNNVPRILGPKVTAEMLPVLFESVRSGDYPLAIREQSMMTLTLRWQLNRDLNQEILDGLGDMFEKGIAPAENWQLPVTILINAAALGGDKLRSKARPYYQDCASRYDNYPFGDNTEGIFSLPAGMLTKMLRKGIDVKFADAEKELDNFFHPHQPEDPEDLMKPRTPVHRETPKINRNDPCPCGSGKKYKKCCGR